MKNQSRISGYLSGGILVAAVAAAVLALSPRPSPSADTSPRFLPGKYVGAQKCKNCHGKEATGDQYATALKMKHAKAFETLASPEALEAGKKKGVQSPQTSEKCLKCHVTAFEAPKDATKKIEPPLGVQCESCHGPGDGHVKARMAAAGSAEEGAVVEVPAGEILMPTAKSCKGCHNEESPSFKEFKCAERVKEILHLNPKRGRKADETIARVCKE